REGTNSGRGAGLAPAQVGLSAGRQERGNNDTPPRAEALPPLTAVAGTVVPGDVDYFRIQLGLPGRLIASAGGVRLTLLTADGRELVRSEGDVIDQHLDGGVYLLEVSSSSPASYLLRADVYDASDPLGQQPAGYLPVAVVVADVDRDGVPDLVTLNSGSDDVAVMLGVGDGS